MTREDVTLAKRKAGLIIVIVLGVISILASWPMALVMGADVESPCGTTREPSYAACALFFFGGVALVAYGSYAWSKVTHVEWTKQAIREHEEQEQAVTHAVRQYYEGKREAAPAPLDEVGLEARRAELMEVIELLDKRFLEGKIGQEVYKQMKDDYATKLTLLESKTQTAKKNPHERAASATAEPEPLSPGTLARVLPSEEPTKVWNTCKPYGRSVIGKVSSNDTFTILDEIDHSYKVSIFSLTILDEVFHFYKVRLHNGKIGYIVKHRCTRAE